MATASATGTNGATMRKAGDWARRAPLLPALIFVIAMTQLPFVATIVISFMNWNAYYPDERGFTGFDNYVSSLHRHQRAQRRRRHHRADGVGRPHQPDPRARHRPAAGPQVPGQGRRSAR